jgi:hypothetical protein
MTAQPTLSRLNSICARNIPDTPGSSPNPLYIGSCKQNNPHPWGLSSGPGGIRTLGLFSAIEAYGLSTVSTDHILWSSAHYITQLWRRKYPECPNFPCRVTNVAHSCTRPEENKVTCCSVHRGINSTKFNRLMHSPWH